MFLILSWFTFVSLTQETDVININEFLKESVSENSQADKSHKFYFLPQLSSHKTIQAELVFQLQHAQVLMLSRCWVNITS